MSRSLSAWSGAPSNAFMYANVICVVGDVPTTITASAYNAAGDTNPIEQHQIAVGPDLDWRGGLSAWSQFKIQIANDFQAVVAGSGDQVFSALYGLRSVDSVDADTFVSHFVNDAGTSYLNIQGGSAGFSAGVRVFTGYLRDIAQSDFQGLVLSFGDKRDLYLNKPFLNLLGYGDTSTLGNMNTDIRLNARPFNMEQLGRPVPLVYGRPQYAVAVLPHIKPSFDLINNGHGLVAVFSDNAFVTPKTNDPEIYIPGDGTGAVNYCEIQDHTGDTQYEWITGTDVIRIGGTSGIRGAIVGFTDDMDGSGNGRAGNGFLLATRQLPIRWVQGFNQLTLAQAELDDDDTTSVNSTAVGTLPGIVSIRLRVAADDEFSVQFYRVFLRIKIETDASRVWSKGAPPQAFQADTSGPASNQVISGASAVPTSNFVFNNWTAGNKESIRFDNNANLQTADDGLSFQLNCDSSDGLLNQVKVYGGVVDIWYERPWSQYLDSIYGAVDGINDATYRYDSSGFLKNPAEIAGHFIVEVLGGSIDATNFAAESAKMDTDGIELGFQLVDDGETGADVLEKIATQGMCWIVPDDYGDETIIYRPRMAGVDADAQAPFSVDSGTIIAGTVKWSLTPREDVSRGVVVNYNWNAITREYNSQKITAPSASTGPYQTILSTGGAKYTAFCDGIADPNARPLIVDADYIVDDDTAERLCKWLTLLHGRRRQIVEFDAPLESAKYTVGDVIYIDLPQVRVHCSGDALNSNVGVVTSTSTTYDPSGDTTHKGLAAACDQDLFHIASGTYEGYYRLTWTGSAWNLNPPLGLGNIPVSDPWRALPAFDVLSAKIVSDNKSGTRVHFKAVEHPVFFPQTNDV